MVWNMSKKKMCWYCVVFFYSKYVCLTLLVPIIQHYLIEISKVDKEKRNMELIVTLTDMFGRECYEQTLTEYILRKSFKGKHRKRQ